jgi:hypothetical protein
VGPYGPLTPRASLTEPSASANRPLDGGGYKGRAEEGQAGLGIVRKWYLRPGGDGGGGSGCFGSRGGAEARVRPNGVIP